MKVGGIAGQKADGSIQGLGIGDSTTMLKKFKKEKFAGFAKVIFLDNFGRRISKRGSTPPPPKPAPAKPAPVKAK